MRRVINYFVYALIVMILITYILGLYDDAFYKTGVWYKDILGSIKYYITWVLPYWWLIILITSLTLAFLFYGIKEGINKIRNK